MTETMTRPGEAVERENRAWTPLPVLTDVVEERAARVADQPITVETWLDICGPKDWSELIDGVLVEKPMTQRDHETLQGWLYNVLSIHVHEKGLGFVAGSRTATPINTFRGRLPDLLFVRKDRMDIVQQKAVRGAPDLIVEIVSPNDGPMHLRGPETDYRNIGVAEIWFLDQIKGTARILLKRGDDYEETVLTEGMLAAETVPGFALPLESLLKEPRPSAYGTITRLLSASDS